MKKLLFLFALLVSGVAWAQTTYTVDWFQIAGGGNTVASASSNSVYEVSGTAGQVAAGGPLTNGVYSLTGGFWSLYSLPTPVTPKLNITYSGGNATVSWAYPSTGWVLQQSSALNGNWYDTAGVSNNGVSNYAVVPMPQGILYFRLVYVLQSPGAPTMTIYDNQSPSGVVVSWTYPSPGWTLQTNNDLANGSWGNYVGTVISNTVTNLSPNGNLFFRLKAP